ncbi:MAG TPA: hypothetical protein PKJ33_01850 [Alphaproteobacteria bacterium]|nr:hypothetical protein [Alphaproteobacteria bacterium]
MNSKFKNFHIITLFTLLILIGGKNTSAQTIDNELPQDKIRNDDKRKLEVVKDTINYKDLYTIFTSLASFSSNNKLIKLHSLRYDNGQVGGVNIGTYEHEWNHYKNYMFGSKIHGLTKEETFLLEFYNELTSFCLTDLVGHRKWFLEDILNKGDFFLKDTSTMETRYERWLTGIFLSKDSSIYKETARKMIEDGPSKEEIEIIVKSNTEYLLNSKQYYDQFIRNTGLTLAESKKIKKPNHKNIFEEIVKNMFIVYIDNKEINLLKYESNNFILNMNQSLLSNQKIQDMIFQTKPKVLEYKHAIKDFNKADRKFQRAKNKTEKLFKKEQNKKHKEIVKLKKQIDELQNK